MDHLATAELEARLGEVRESPADGSTLEMIVQRPEIDVRVVLAEGELNSELGTAMKLRGINARLVTPGRIRQGDTITKL